MTSWSLFFIFCTVPHSARISRFRRATQRMIRWMSPASHWPCPLKPLPLQLTDSPHPTTYILSVCYVLLYVYFSERHYKKVELFLRICENFQSAQGCLNISRDNSKKACESGDKQFEKWRLYLLLCSRVTVAGLNTVTLIMDSFKGWFKHPAHT